jgi:putative flippase GtrA
MSWRTQAVRFFLVGALSNLACYVLYLGLTTAGLGPKLSMTTVFAIAATQTYFANRHWSFQRDGWNSKSVAKYATAYASAYILNLVALTVLCDLNDLPHQVVQLSAIAVIAAAMFFVQRHWVFSS